MGGVEGVERFGAVDVERVDDEPKRIDQLARVTIEPRGVPILRVDVDRPATSSNGGRRSAVVCVRCSVPRPGCRGDAAMSGFLMCPTCGVGVDLSKSDGSSCCQQHRPKEPRVYITPSMQSVDLDASLADAEQEHKQAQDRLAAAQAQLHQAEAAVRRYDETHRDDGNDAA